MTTISQPRKFALIAGSLMLIMAVFSLIPGLQGGTDSLPGLHVEASYGLFLGIFPMNIFNKLALLLFGAGGIMAYRNHQDSAYAVSCYARWVFWVMAPAAILGIIPATSTLFWILALVRAEVVAHGGFALAAAVFAFGKSPAPSGVQRRAAAH